MDYCGVFRISPEGETTLVIKDLVYPNGLAFSPDESLLYVNDTREFLIRVFDVRPDGGVRELRAYPIEDDGTLGAHIVLHTFGGITGSNTYDA